mmetsp:Transcript_47726/g.83526  ORF Transcript_47726/g.83526 Transcript_47726/m.83526 type:complete len:200 (-) Transcript_47726:430-1029(-)
MREQCLFPFFHNLHHIVGLSKGQRPTDLFLTTRHRQRGLCDRICFVRAGGVHLRAAGKFARKSSRKRYQPRRDVVDQSCLVFILFVGVEIFAFFFLVRGFVGRRAVPGLVLSAVRFLGCLDSRWTCDRRAGVRVGVCRALRGLVYTVGDGRARGRCVRWRGSLWLVGTLEILSQRFAFGFGFFRAESVLAADGGGKQAI